MRELHEMGEAVEYNVGEETEEGGEGGGKHRNGEQGGLEEFSDRLLNLTCIKWCTKCECGIIHVSTVKWVITFCTLCT